MATRPPYKHSIPDEERRDNGDGPGLTAWDHKPGDPERHGSHDFRTEEDRRLTDVNQPSGYAKLPDASKATLQAWIGRELVSSPDVGHRSSYGLKHLFCDSDGGFYVTNGQFKGAMLEAGFAPVDPYEVNWVFGYRTPRGDPRGTGNARARRGGA